jgi:hypothetical protein
MKNKIFYYLILFGILLTFNTCKKDYPDDIPKWVKDEIKKWKKTSDDYNNEEKGYKLIRITEYTVNGEKIYAIGEYLDKYYKFSEVYYNYNKEYWCLKNNGSYVGNCEDFIKNNCTSSRLIWEEQPH